MKTKIGTLFKIAHNDGGMRRPPITTQIINHSLIRRLTYDRMLSAGVLKLKFMLHARPDYNRIQDPENKIPQDEPVFLLRAQDKFAPELLLRWASKMRLQAKDKVMADSMARMVEVHAMKMIEWQTKNGSKDPDINFFDSAYDHYTLP
jgi:hypothetical protein